MIEQSVLSDIGLTSPALLRGIVTDVAEDSRFAVRLQRGDEDWTIVADLVITADTPVHLGPGDSVLCWIDKEDRERGLILGRIGRAITPTPATVAVEGTVPTPDEAPDILVLEAKHSLTLRVGDGSITIREDGKILIKGKDLVSHAQRLNRIKGGAVQIN